MTLTWKQFKDMVDNKLKDIEVSENINIWYIDISFTFHLYFLSHFQGIFTSHVFHFYKLNGLDEIPY